MGDGILMRRILYLVLLLACLPLHGQTSSVTATLTDSDGVTWNSGTCTMLLVQPQYPPVIAKRIDNGSTVPTSPACTVSVSGVLSTTVTDVGFIAPANSKWQFKVCPNVSSGGTGCGITALPIHGSSVSVTGQLNLPPPRVGGGVGSFAYADVEVAPLLNNFYQNTVLGQCRAWTGSWGTCASGGAGATLPTNAIVYGLSATTSRAAVGSRDGSGDYQQPITVVGLGGGLNCALVGTQWQCTLSGGGLTGAVNTGAAHQVGAYPASGTTIGPAPNIYVIDPGMSASQIAALLGGLSGTNSYIIPAGTPQALYATNGQAPFSLRISDNYFQMPGVACDGKGSALGIQITSGSNTSFVGSLLSSADVGKTFFFFNKSGFAFGLTQSVWTAKLSGYTFPTATWSASAPFTNAGQQVYYGTDSLASVISALAQAGPVFPLTIPTGCQILVNGTIPWSNSQVIVGRHQGSGGFIGRPGADVIATTDTSGQSISTVGTGLKGFTITNGTEIDWTLGYNLYAADGTLTVVPPVYRPLYDHGPGAPHPLAPGWLTGGKNGVASITQNSAVVCTPNAYAPPAVGQQIMFPYFINIFTSTVSSTAGSCSAGFTARTMAAAFPNTSAYTAAQAEWFTGSAIQSTTTTIPTSITYPFTITTTLSVDPVPGWPSNFPQTGHIKLCGAEFDYGGTGGTSVVIRKGPSTSAGCTGTTPMAPMNRCAAKNLFGSSSDQPWPVTPSINAGNSTPSGANWFPGECGGNFAVAFPTANGNAYVGSGLVGGFLEDLNFQGSAFNNTGNANNAGEVLIQGNNAPFASRITKITGQNLQYGIVQGPASSGQHGVAAVGPTGFGNTIENLWLFAAFPLAFVDFQGSSVDGVNMNSTEISPFDGTAVGSSTCLQVGFTLDEQTGGVVTTSQYNTIHPYGCEPENGSHAWVNFATDIQGSHISMDTANFEGIPNLIGGDHFKCTNCSIPLPAIDYGIDNDFGVLDGSNAGYITNTWDASRPQFLLWGKNATCSAFAGGQGPAIACGASTVQGYQGRGIDPSIYGTKAHFILGGMITPWMWQTAGNLDTNPFTATGAPDATATYWGASSQCALGGGALCHTSHFNGFNGFLYVGPFNQVYDGPYSLDATFKSSSAPSSFTLTIRANDSGTGQCASGSSTTVYSGTISTTTSFAAPAVPPDFDMTGHAGCVLDITYSAGSTTDTILTDRFNLVPRPGYVRGPVAAPTYPGSCPAGTPPSSWLGSFSGFAYFCDGGTVHRVAIT